MKNLMKLIALSCLILFFTYCQKSDVDVRGQCEKEIVEVNEAKLLLEYFEKNGDPANCTQNCTVDAKEVHQNLDKNFYVIDLRSQGAFQSGHIEGAVRLNMNKLFYHFNEKIEPFQYDKIVLVCYSGQSAAYATSLLRLQGFYNVYALKWGMASWNHKFSDKWTSKLSLKDKLAITQDKENLSEKHELPVIKTGKVWRSDIMKDRAKTLLSEGFKKASIKTGELSEDNGQVILAYCTEDVYNQGHPEGAIHFPVKKSLKRTLMLQNLPTNKEIIVYSENGFESSYATAYLRILGYNAKTLLYGCNMFNIATANQFSASELNEYPLATTNNNETAAPVEEEGGC